MARIISAVILAFVVLTVVLYATPILFLIGIGIVGTVCLYEYFLMIRQLGIQAQSWFGYLGFWILLAAFYQSKLHPTAIMAPLLLVAFVSTLWHRYSMRERIQGLMAEWLGILYLALFLYPALQVRYDFGGKIGLQWTVILLAVIWAGDSTAMLIGKKWGKNLLSPIISPHKTKEGAVGGLIASVGIALLLQHFLFPDLPLLHVAIASLLLGIFGQLGDLAESILKRAAGIKDSSQFIPGHGGVLDRIDSLLFACPVLYLYLLALY